MPVVDDLAARFRVVLPDLPLHGDSEDRPRHPYTVEWLADVMAGFSAEVLGPRPAIGGHQLGAEIVLEAGAPGPPAARGAGGVALPAPPPPPPPRRGGGGAR